MPTYRNDTASPIVEQFLDKNGMVTAHTIAVGATFVTEYILTNPNLTLVTMTPQFNPLYFEPKTVTSSGPGDDQQVDIHIDTKELSIWNNTAALVLAYLNGQSNTPPLYVYPYSEKVLNLNHNVDRIYFSFSAAATIYVEGRK